MGLKLVPFNV